MSKELLSAFKAFTRTLIIGEIFIAIAVIGIITTGINKELGTFLINWNVALATFVFDTLITIKIALGTALSEYLHKSGIETPLNLKSMDVLKK